MTFTLTPAIKRQMRTATLGELPKVYDKFRLISQTTVFMVRRVYLAAGFIPSVYGETLDGKYATCARIADIIILDRSANKDAA